MYQRHFTWIAAFALGTASCSGIEPEQDVSITSSPIIGGKATGVCEWPTTVMVGSGCSGTLVHPRVVMTAKHCLTKTPASISFGEARGQFVRTVRISTCFKNPQSDFGFCTLAEDVTGIPIVPVMAPCEMSELKTGAMIVEAGFGDQTGAQTGFGMKKWIQGTIAMASPTRTTVQVTSGTQDGEYFGDSGGPVFLRMPDTTWRLIGNDFSSPDWNSSGKPRVSTYTSVPFHVAWAEQQSGIDITPCHDATGWNPGPDCKGFPTNPGEGVGTWANSCSGQTMLVAATCNGNGADGGIIFDASGPRPDGSMIGPDSRSEAPTDAHATGATPDAVKDVYAKDDSSGGTGGMAGVATRDGPTPSAVPDALVDVGSTVKPGSSGNNAAGGCSCEITRGNEAPTFTSFGAIAGCAVALLHRRRRSARAPRS